MVAGNQIRFFVIAAKSMVLMLYIMWAPYGHAQQIPQYSQYTFNSLHINPAYAGYKIDPFVQATYRSQFMAFPGAPETFSITADMASSDELMGFGASLFSDRLGATKVHGALLTYSYKIKVTNNSYLSMGVSAGTSEYVLDGNLLMPDDVTDMTIPMERINMFTPNLNAGLFFHSEKFFSGLSVFNLVGQRNLENQDVALAVHNNHYFLQIGSILPLSAETAFKPSLLIREDFSSPTSFDLNAMFLFYDRFWVGTSYRSSIGKNSSGPAPSKRNAIAFLIDLFLTDSLRFGYAYDFNLSRQNNFINNSHEISLGYYLGSKTLTQKPYKTF
ncbi:PorP/SprF family type IX secretion system membrane protein [Lunatibacter salilacus]|uniref:PorP/SprF family type IX secretion system membrane protein n=1 Tax=Lunatibacter salilacus TaxID=2483804 RepID=UPI00131B2E21|nr:type IX secretion system membrane protein PorP/SprF [Lunatibacter salilacus]